jgi:GMP synthase-like glutamine amidotransferase
MRRLPTLRSMERPGLVLQHDADVPPALFGEWLESRGIGWELVDVPRDGVPEMDGAPWIAVLGSHSSAAANDPDWVPAEGGLIRSAIAADVPVLGICFGGQALSLALGGEVHPAPVLEGSWDEGIELLDEQIPAGPWLNLHFESFTLPPGAELLARTPAGPSAFRHGPHLGTQFHPEVTPEIVAAWSERYRPAHPDVDYERLARDGEANRAAAPARAFELFDRWWERLERADG